ncbi:CDP-alcohol phosphatidyltransferase family protein [Paracoccus sp. JM45]|nr:CDP-alcohol phosphatidyltransferase family protein [Paracoccus sp. JM45]
MQISDPQNPTKTNHRRVIPSGVVPAILAGMAVSVLTGAFALHQGQSGILSGGIFLLAAGGIMRGAIQHYPHSRFGACNAVTMARMALGCALLASLVTGQVAGWAVATVAAVSLALDGIDGFLARRSGLMSDFGARFDMEVDAAFALILSLHALIGDPVGLEVLVLGLMRYLFIGAGFIWPWLTAPLCDSIWRKAICVLQIATLIILQLPFLSEGQGIIIARIASAALLWSFGRDILWLRARR